MKRRSLLKTILAAPLALLGIKLGKAVGSEELIPDSTSTIKNRPTTYAIAISDSQNVMVVGVRYDGNVDFGKGITPEAAAMEFWNRVGVYVRGKWPEAKKLAENPVERADDEDPSLTWIKIRNPDGTIGRLPAWNS